MSRLTRKAARSQCLYARKRKAYWTKQCEIKCSKSKGGSRRPRQDHRALANSTMETLAQLIQMTGLRVMPISIVQYIERNKRNLQIARNMARRAIASKSRDEAIKTLRLIRRRFVGRSD